MLAVSPVTVVLFSTKKIVFLLVDVEWCKGKRVVICINTPKMSIRAPFGHRIERIEKIEQYDRIAGGKQRIENHRKL
jgi:hypothetical protein